MDLHTIKVLELPPSESCNNLVRFEFRYGMNVDFPSTNAEMTLPSVDSDKLILPASFRRCPLACDFDCRSLPCYTFLDIIIVCNVRLNRPNAAFPHENVFACPCQYYYTQ